ncbi:MAG: AIR synthase-related protein, partial [Myxococcota bacterium]
MPMEVLLGKPPKMTRQTTRTKPKALEWRREQLGLAAAVDRVLAFPAVADKSFLIHIGDRTVGGLSSRDQLVGPWQVPVSDVAVTASAYEGYTGEAFAMGERAPLALIDPAASGRMAVGEALTNLAAAAVSDLARVKLSANWMAAAGHPGEDARLYEAVRAVGVELGPALGIAIPVGKDSMSMRTLWSEGGEPRSVIAPLSLIVSAFAPVTDVRRALTPELRTDLGDTRLLLVDLGGGQHRLGGSALAQVHGVLGDIAPDLDDPARLSGFFAAIQQLSADRTLIAYHDRSDGGLLTTAVEMAFAGHAGVDLDLPAGRDPFAMLFSEELGAVIQIRADDLDDVSAVLRQHGLKACVSRIGKL